MAADIPPLEPNCNSWIISRKGTGEAVCELFVRGNVELVNTENYVVETAATYLARINRELRDRGACGGRHLYGADGDGSSCYGCGKPNPGHART